MLLEGNIARESAYMKLFANMGLIFLHRAKWSKQLTRESRLDTSKSRLLDQNDEEETVPHHLMQKLPQNNLDFQSLPLLAAGSELTGPKKPFLQDQGSRVSSSHIFAESASCESSHPLTSRRIVECPG
jgi:hypothetical protein